MQYIVWKNNIPALVAVSFYIGFKKWIAVRPWVDTLAKMASWVAFMPSFGTYLTVSKYLTLSP